METRKSRLFRFALLGAMLSGGDSMPTRKTRRQAPKPTLTKSQKKGRAKSKKAKKARRRNR